MWTTRTRTLFWYEDEDDQGSISPILTGISGLKWRRICCDGCSFNLFCYIINLNKFSKAKSEVSHVVWMLRNHIAEEHFVIKFILSVSNSHQRFGEAMDNFYIKCQISRHAPKAVGPSPKLYSMLLIEYWLWASKGNKNDINTRSTIVTILSESHQDLGATETFFWTCYFPLWCNSCCGDPRIVYKCCLQNGKKNK